MAFLFKSKKNQPGTALPPATRNVHTSEGAPSSGSPPIANGVKTEGNAFSQTPTPSSSYNNSLNSAASPTSPDAVKMRQRAESESQVSRLSAVLAPEWSSLTLVCASRSNGRSSLRTGWLKVPIRPCIHGRSAASISLRHKQPHSLGMVRLSIPSHPKRATFI